MSKKDEVPGSDGASGAKPSRASVGRLSLNLRRLEMLHREGVAKVSSRLLGEALGVTDAQDRKDLAYLGNLARALLRYQGFIERGFRFVALFDADPAKIAETIEGLPVHPLEAIPAVVAVTKAELGVLTVPSEAAQSVAEALAAAGIRGVLNFTPQVLRLPAEVSVVSVDLTVQLEHLAFLVQMSGEDQ